MSDNKAIKQINFTAAKIKLREVWQYTLTIILFILFTVVLLLVFWLGYFFCDRYNYGFVKSLIFWGVAILLLYYSISFLIKKVRKVVTGEDNNHYKDRIGLDREIKKEEANRSDAPTISQIIRANSFSDEVVLPYVFFILFSVVGYLAYKNITGDKLSVYAIWLCAIVSLIISFLKIMKRLEKSKTMLGNSSRENEIINYTYSFLIPYLSAYGQLGIDKIKKIERDITWISSDYYVDVDDEFGPSAYPEIIGISDNTAINWSIELITYFKEKWNWQHLSRNVSLNFSSESLIECFEDKWDWKELSKNTSLKLNINLIERFKNKWNWNSSNFHLEHGNINFLEEINPGICGNRNVDWDYDMIMEFHELIDWHALSLNPNTDFTRNIPINKFDFDPIERNCNRRYTLLNAFENWDFKDLSFNPAIGKLIQQLEDNEKIQFLKNNDWDWTGISNNNSIPWSESLLEVFCDRIDWESFSRYNNNEFNWTIEFLEKQKTKLNWSNLSSNNALPWSMEFINHFKDLWSWKNISLNSGIPWTEDILHKYSIELHWDILSTYGVFWDRNLMKEFKDKINWKKLSYNREVKWTFSLFRQHYKELDLGYIFSNESEFPLTWEFFRYYLNDPNCKPLILLNNKHFCEKIVRPCLTEETVNKLLEIYISRQKEKFRHY